MVGKLLGTFESVRPSNYRYIFVKFLLKIRDPAVKKFKSGFFTYYILNLESVDDHRTLLFREKIQRSYPQHIEKKILLALVLLD